MNLKVLVLVSLLAASLPSFAHEAQKGPNGGRVADAGAYHVEMVAAENTVDIFLTDSEDKAVSPSGFKGTAILIVNGKPHRIVLEAAGGAKLTGKASVALPAQPKGAIQLIAPDGKTASAKFN